MGNTIYFNIKENYKNKDKKKNKKMNLLCGLFIIQITLKKSFSHEIKLSGYYCYGPKK